MNKTIDSLELSISFNFRAGKPDFARSLAFASTFGTSLQERGNSEMGYCKPVTRILCGGGGGWGANETKVDQTTEMYFLSNSF